MGWEQPLARRYPEQVLYISITNRLNEKGRTGRSGPVDLFPRQRDGLTKRSRGWLSLVMFMHDSIDCILHIDRFPIEREFQVEIGGGSLDGSGVRSRSRSGRARGAGCSSDGSGGVTGSSCVCCSSLQRGSYSSTFWSLDFDARTVYVSAAFLRARRMSETYQKQHSC